MNSKYHTKIPNYLVWSNIKKVGLGFSPNPPDSDGVEVFGAGVGFGSG